jgi:hypothetical protein
VFRRHEVKTHGRLAREELNESLEHLRMAAAHATSSAAGALAPRFDDARKAATEGFDSLRVVARDSARTANAVARKGKAKLKKKEAPTSRKRWSMVVSGLAAGVLAGAAAALFSRRRARQERWHEYGTTRTETGLRDESDLLGMASKNSRP